MGLKEGGVKQMWNGRPTGEKRTRSLKETQRKQNNYATKQIMMMVMVIVEHSLQEDSH